jgi:hypothetical protein
VIDIVRVLTQQAELLRLVQSVSGPKAEPDKRPRSKQRGINPNDHPAGENSSLNHPTAR